MKLKDCKIGMIIIKPESPLSYDQIGHIVGLDMNSLNEVIVKVLWADGSQYSINPCNIEPL